MQSIIEPPASFFEPVKINGVIAAQVEKDRVGWKADLLPIDEIEHQKAVKEWQRRHAEVIAKQKPVRHELDEELSAVASSRPVVVPKSHEYARQKLIETAPAELQKLHEEAKKNLRDITHDDSGYEKMLYLHSRLRQAEISGDAERYREIHRSIESIERNSQPLLERIAKLEERMVLS